MSIGIYDPYLNTLGGGEKYMLTAASCLSQKHSVDVFWDNQNDLNRGSDRFDIDLSKVRRVSNVFNAHHSAIQKILQTSKYDAIFYLSDGSIPFVGSKKLFIHFQFPVEWVHTSSINYKVKLSRVSSIICNSEFTKRYIDKKFRVSSIVLYPPIEIQKFRQPQQKTNTILTVGRYGKLPDGTDYKKQSLLIQAFKKFYKNPKMKNWKLIIVTSFLDRDSQYISDLEKTTHDFPIEILKNVPNKKIIDLYKQSTIYWHASGFGEDLEKNPDRAEHFGISTVEAMAAGAVPVVIQAGGQTEIVTNGVNGFLWNTEEELLKKTEEIIENENLRKSLSKNAQEKAQDFSSERFAKELNKIFV